MRRMVLASLGRRIGAMAIDGLVCVGLWWLLLKSGALGGDLAKVGRPTLSALGSLWDSGGLARAAVGLWTVCAAVQGGLGSLQGRSLGRLALGLRVVDRWGMPVSRVLGAARGVLAATGAIVLGAGPGFVLVSRRQRALHDLVLATFIVRRVDGAAIGSTGRPPRKDQSAPSSAEARQRVPR
jgi:uncharacterized RDD family membrane protein YckC